MYAVYTAPEVLMSRTFPSNSMVDESWLINAKSNNYESSCVQTDQTNYEHY